MPENGSDDSLRGWGKHVLKELDRNHDDHGTLFARLNRLDVEIAKLGVKAAFAGGIAGGILSIAVALVIWLITK